VWAKKDYSQGCHGTINAVLDACMTPPIYEAFLPSSTFGMSLISKEILELLLKSHLQA